MTAGSVATGSQTKPGEQPCTYVANIDLHPADDIVEITLGEHRIAGDTLRLLADHPDTCLRTPEALHDARNKLIGHLHAKASHDPAMSQLDSISSASMAN